MGWPVAMAVGVSSNAASGGIWSMCARKMEGASLTSRDAINVSLAGSRNVWR